MDDTKADIALNSTQCIRTASHFGYDEVVNICSGVRTTIEWGGADWMWMSILVLGALVTIGIVLAMGLAILRDF